jgi:hypothetical protein
MTRYQAEQMGSCDSRKHWNCDVSLLPLDLTDVRPIKFGLMRQLCGV